MDVERGRTVKGWRPRRLGEHCFLSASVFTRWRCKHSPEESGLLMNMLEMFVVSLSRWWTGWHQARRR